MLTDLTHRELGLFFTTIAWMYSYLQWSLLKIIPLGYLLWQKASSPILTVYFVTNMMGDTALHYQRVGLGIMFFYFSQLLICLYILARKDTSNRFQVFGAWSLLYLPSIWSTVYSMVVYALLSIYALTLAIPFSTGNSVYLGEGLTLLALSDLLVLGQLLGYQFFQPFALVLYYLSQLFIAHTEFITPT